MDKSQVIIMIILAFLGFIVQGLFIHFEFKKDYIKAVILKGCASLIFLTVGIIGFTLTKNINFGIFVLIGLTLGVIGDILLNLRFVVKPEKSNLVFLIGTASFLLGHIMYIIGLFTLADNKFIYIPIIVAIFVTGTIGYFIFTKLEVKSSMKAFGIIYILIVSLFTSIAFYNFILTRNNFTLHIGLGSLLFFLSDVILIFNSFGKHPRKGLRITNLMFYYKAQLLIGMALLFI